MINIQYDDSAATKHFLLIKERLKTRIKNILKYGSVTIDKKKYIADPIIKQYLTSLQDDVNLKELITARPESFPKIIRSLKRRIPNIMNTTTHGNRVLYNLFVNSCYDDAVFKKLDFIKGINRNTCLYCNRSYTYSLEAKKKIKPEIDHFYPKGIYPSLAISYYNLIPSCQTCNGLGVKDQNDPRQFGLKNPYLITNSDFIFTYEILNGNILNSLTDPESIELKFSKSIHGHLKIFKLKELYEKHKDHVIELIIKSKSKYPDSYRKYLMDYQNKGVKFNNNEIDRMIIGNYVEESELHKRPLSKLYRDIAKELGLIT